MTAWYRLYLMETDGKIMAAENLECDGDEDAVERATAAFRASAYPLFELWQGERLVHKGVRGGGR